MWQGQLVTRVGARLAGILIALTLASACSSEADSESSVDSKSSPVEVPVRVVEERKAAVSRTFAARTVGSREVEVRARVGGLLESRDYSEGSAVNADDILFRIGPERYEVRVQRAEAELARAEAVERQARREWELVSSLFEEDAISQRERDEALSVLELAQTGLELAEAELAEARIDLGYVEVKAPISGIVGLSEYAKGSLVDAGTLLASVTQLDPMHVQFSIPEEQMAAFSGQIRSGSGLDVALTLPDDSQYPETGRLDFTESGVDPSTGTVLVRAIFPNESHDLLPGQFVRVTLSDLEIGRMIQLPREAVAEDSEGPIVYVLDEEDIPQPTSVKLGPDMPDGEVAVTEGLSSGDRVVAVSIHGLNEGVAVKPETEDPPEDSDQGGEGDR